MDYLSSVATAIGAAVTALGDLVQGALDAQPGLTVAEVARRGRLTPQLVYGWLDGTRPLKEFPKPRTMAGLARALNVTETAVFDACLRDLGFDVQRSEEADPRRAVLLAAAQRVPDEQVRQVTRIVQSFLDEAGADPGDDDSAR